MKLLAILFTVLASTAYADVAEHARLLAQWDMMKPGTERDALADRIDKVAGQRYATTSRLYWHQNLDDAKAEAKRTGKPILSLRMLGRLDEDLSCANSRYFRVALYANTAVSKFMRDSFVLHWSSERPVPKITIDFGDGRKLLRTITGNSIHYVLDADGKPIDALPGLYAPAVFEEQLRGSLALLGKSGHDLTEAHRLAMVARMDQWKQIAKITVPIAGDGFRAESYAQLVTATKSGEEMPMYRIVDLGTKVGNAPDDANVWAQLGLRLMPNRIAAAKPAYPGVRLRQRSYYANPTQVHTDILPQLFSVPEILDASSKQLLAKLAMAWSDTAPVPAKPEEFARLVTRFERDILADTGMNEFDIRLQVHGLLASRPELTFEQLNAEIYRVVFATPKDDPWLGLKPTGISALPADGVVR
jgi:hypothetical protein